MTCRCYIDHNGDIDRCPLHAAAPDMAKALEAAEPFINGQGSARALVLIRAALAKARGETSR